MSIKRMLPEASSEMVELSSRFFRPGSKIAPRRVTFVLTDGGIGDYICALGCLQWIAKNHPQIIANLYCGAFMMDFAKNVVRHFPNWTVHLRETLTEEILKADPFMAPIREPINGVGAHLLDLAFIYYLGINPAPKDAYMPVLDFTEEKFPVELLGKKYAVLTPGAINEIRTLPPAAFNGMKNHLISSGILPVLLGKSHVVDQRFARFHPEYNFDGCLNLIDKTTLVEAAFVMSRATLVAGLDNGLLHLAGCTETPIIFGFTIASPEHRKPKRPKGKTWVIAPNPKVLPCTFCQSQMRLVGSWEFSNCVYGDTLCLYMIGSDPGQWNACIDEILKDG